jgi:hypothetical protein
MRDFQLGYHIHLIGVSQTGRRELATSFDFGSGARRRAVASVSRGYHLSGWAVQSSTCANVARALASFATAQRNLFGAAGGPRQVPALAFLAIVTAISVNGSAAMAVAAGRFRGSGKKCQEAQYIQQVLDKAFRSALERLNRPENYFKTETEQII